MDNTIVYVMMIVNALLMAMLPFGVFMGLGSVLGVPSTDTRIFVAYVLATLVFSYLTALGSFALIQRNNCGSIKNMKQISSNAGIAFGIQFVSILLVWLVPFLRNLVTGLLPPDLDKNILDAVGYSYFALWASLYGTAVGGTLSAVCGK